MNNDIPHPGDAPDFEAEYDDSGLPASWQQEADVERWPRSIHYLIGIVCCLLDFAIHFVNWLGHIEKLYSVREGWGTLAHFLINSIAGSMMFFGPFLLVERRLRKIPFPRAPGDYLLLALTVRLLFPMVVQLIVYFWGLSTDEQIAKYVQLFPLMTTGIALLPAVVMLLAWPRASRPWRIGIVCVVAFSSLANLGGYFQLIQYSGVAFQLVRLLPVAILIWVCAADMRLRSRYSWTHWLGVGMQLYTFVMPFAHEAIRYAMDYLQARGLF